ncbi:hypothetical protein PCANB_001659 [Pneumocystis canis]|nr:hypothetical protein PCK1_001983 [Pneumocystis canis]KAG5436837.1 hypothetical protein PCANB_001659 [Pneumocystis canis]
MIEQQEEDYSSLPLLERAVHKIWKVRLGAYEEMSRLFSNSTSEKDPVFRPFLLDVSLWKKISIDSNVFAQEAGINALKDFLEFCGKEACIKTRSTVIPCIVEKCLISTRPGTKQKSIDVILLYVELDSPDSVLDDLLPILDVKFPKLVSATVNIIKEIYRLFGVKTVNPKPILKILPKLFAHNDNGVRKEAIELAVTLYSWLGDIIRSSLFSELKPVQIKELELSFEKVEVGKVSQERYLRSQQPVLLEDSSKAVLLDSETNNTDFFDSIEPVNILSKIPKDFNDQLMSAKWKDRKDALDILYSICKVPRILEDDYSDIIRLLARSIKDVNISVTIAAGNCVEAFARGLRSGFSKYKSFVLGPIMEKLKERKVTVIETLSNAMDAIFDSTSLSDVLDDILEFSKHKNPQIRTEVLLFLVRCLKSTCIYPKSSEIKLVVESCKGLLSDTFEPVRNSSAEVMGTLMKIMGERHMNSILNGVDDLRKAKIKEYFESAEVKVKPDNSKQSALFKKLDEPNISAKVISKTASSNEVKKVMLKSSFKHNDSQTFSKQLSLASHLPSVNVNRLGVRSSPKLSSSLRLATSKKIKNENHTVNSPFKMHKSKDSVQHTPVKLAGKVIDSNDLCLADKQELEELRKEKLRFDEKLQKEVLEKKNLLNEINSLELRNAQLIDDHTKDILQIKASEIQLVRAKNEIEMMKSQLLLLRKELDQSRLSISNKSINLQNSITNEDKIENLSSNLNDLNSNSSPKQNNWQTSILTANSSSDTEKENSHSKFPIFAKYSNGFSSSSSFGYFNTSLSKSNDISTWDTAADLTARLKERIEQMKRADMRQH